MTYSELIKIDELNSLIAEGKEMAKKIVNDSLNNNESKQVILKEPYNPFDPIVIFDPELPSKTIISKWDPVEPEEGSDPTNNSNGVDHLKQDGIRFPIISLNNNIIEMERIYSFKLYLNEFLPYLELSISDVDEKIQTTDMPGINNNVTIVMIAPIDGANKKIKLDFYIKDCTFEDGIGSYKCEYKLNTLYKRQCKQIGDDKLSTFDMLYNISKDCGLGFAATDDCKGIEDKKWRQIYSKTYIEYINEQIKYAGVDEQSVFDVWIDQFGYIVLVNLARIFYENVDPLQLTTPMITGEETDITGAEQSVFVGQRVISNDNSSGVHNLFFETFEQITDNNNVKERGTLRTLYYLGDPCDGNTIHMMQTQVVEDSVDGLEGMGEYEVNNIEFIGIEQFDNDRLFQREIIDSFKFKYFKDKLVVTLQKPNYSLQRGMLVNVVINEYNAVNKRIILDNYDNAAATTKTEIKSDEVSYDDETYDVIEDAGIGVINPALSGVYYIDGIEFNWQYGDSNISQKMFLAKRGIKSRILNKNTGLMIHTKDDE